MDPHRFDRLSKAVASNLTRREAVGGLGLGGVLAALMPWRSAFAQAEAVGCLLDFEATVRLGPSEQTDVRQIAGELDLIINRSGSITKASLRSTNGDEYPVTGQATGRAVNLRIDLGEGRVLIATGTAARDFTDCEGDSGGPATGPERGDLGDWVAVAKAPRADSAGTSDAAVTATAAIAQPTPVAGTPEAAEDVQPTQPASSDTCDLFCGDDTLGLDPSTCSCGCAAGLTPCVWEIGSNRGKGGVIFFGEPVTVRTGACLDTSSDSVNCGGCGVVCTVDERVATAVCDAGVCVYTCTGIGGQCGTGPTDPCSTDLRYDSSNCGACGAICGYGYQCNDGYCQCLLACVPPQELDPTTCTCVCGDGLTPCGSGCVDVSSDSTNCGGCGVMCGTFEECVAGMCEPFEAET